MTLPWFVLDIGHWVSRQCWLLVSRHLLGSSQNESGHVKRLSCTDIDPAFIELD